MENSSFKEDGCFKDILFDFMRAYLYETPLSYRLILYDKREWSGNGFMRLT